MGQTRDNSSLTKVGPKVSQDGFTLPEILISLVVLSIVGLGAYTVMQSTLDAQFKLERTIEKGFGKFNYVAGNIPLQPLRIGFTDRLGWFRVLSPHAILSNGRIIGDPASTTLSVAVLGDDAKLENPVWIKCEGDKAVKVECTKFTNGEAKVIFTLNDKTAALAIARVQAEWPSLPASHPFKRSPEYVYTTPLARDCELISGDPTAPKFLMHNGVLTETVPPGQQACTPSFKLYACLNGNIKVTDHQRVCQ